MSTVEYADVTIETIDRAMRDWLDKTVDARVNGQDGDNQKVPVQFSQGERWSVGRTKLALRDENGVLILPIIAIRRTNIEPDPTRLALGVQTENIQIARRVDPKTSDIQHLEARKSGTVSSKFPPIYDIYTIPFPSRLVVTYQLVIQAQFTTQMNQILQKLWRSLDIQKSFVAPLTNDGRKPPRSTQFGTGDPYATPAALTAPYVVGFLESAAAEGGNFEEFTDTERIVKYTTEIKVPFAMQVSPDEEAPSVRVDRTAYKVVLKDENWHFVDDPTLLDAIFGNKK